MNPITYPAGANQAAVTGSTYVTVGTRGTTFTSLPAGILINDIAIDPDTGDAYFTDSFNCRKISCILFPHVPCG
jgi:sugar lactone lactonase YvrE